MASRKDFSSWLGGQTPQEGSREAALRRYHIPEQGPGSPAPLGRRVIALIIDWLVASGIAWLLFNGHALGQLGVFVGVTIILVATLGHTIGHRLCGIRVRTEHTANGYVGFAAAIIRTLLLSLVIPAVVWDSSGRGLHDMAARTFIVRR
ncbi:RDD family protein [Jonesia quinghaiensis]|uniref:RDD family protein n=1 Tax=Jonesia quinghaiensis TaxID=262806 RepID=UPI00048DE6A0|nr:RDD family protein [Jonesia quinghaiensis]